MNIIELAEWRAIPSFPEYEVSDLGQVRRGERLLSQSFNARGYPRVTLSLLGKPKTRVVHALVAEAFLGARPKGMQICHNDGVKTNNSVLNLRFATAKENEADKAAHGTKAKGSRNGAHTKPDRRPVGSMHGMAKIDESIAKQIKSDLASMPNRSGAVIAKKHGVSIHTVSLIRTGKIWRHA